MAPGEEQQRQVKMETKASYLAAGIFVITTVATLILFLLWLAQVDWTNGQKYDIYFSGSVTGLRVNEVVSYNGVPIGKVEKIDIDPKKVDQVHVIVEIYQPKLIRENSYATLESKGITGTLQVRILGSTRDAPSLKVKNDEERPVIQSQTSSIQAVIDETPRILEKIAHLLEEMKSIVSKENAANLGQTLKNLNTFSESLANQKESVDVFFQTTNKAFSSMGRAGDRLDAAMAQFHDFLAENRYQIKKFTSQNLDNAGDLITHLNRLSQTMDRVLEKLEHSPTQYLLQSQTPAESIPE